MVNLGQSLPQGASSLHPFSLVKNQHWFSSAGVKAAMPCLGLRWLPALVAVNLKVNDNQIDKLPFKILKTHLMMAKSP